MQTIASWDDALLVLELADLADAGFELDLTDFSASEIERLLDQVEDGDAAELDPKYVDVIVCCRQVWSGKPRCARPMACRSTMRQKSSVPCTKGDAA